MRSKFIYAIILLGMACGKNPDDTIGIFSYNYYSGTVAPSNSWIQINKFTEGGYLHHKKEKLDSTILIDHEIAAGKSFVESIKQYVIDNEINQLDTLYEGQIMGSGSRIFEIDINNNIKRITIVGMSNTDLPHSLGNLEKMINDKIKAIDTDQPGGI
jgi:hypothetical protein